MNQYWAGGLLTAFILWSGFMFYEGDRNESHICAVADEKHDLQQSQNTVAAVKSVASVESKQSTISQEASSDYAKNYTSIDSLYASNGVQPPHSALNSVPALRGTPTGTCPSGPGKTKLFKLTPEQCDIEEAKLKGLWNWAVQQSKVKPSAAGQSSSYTESLSLD